MFKGFGGRRWRRALDAVSIAALLWALAPAALAQDAPTSPPAPTHTSQTQPPRETPPATADAAAAQAQVPAGETVAAKGSAEPLYREYKGVALGMSAADVRAKLGKPTEKSDEMDFFVFSDKERARVYYKDGKASSVIATYIGKDAGAPAPASVLGAEIEAKADGSLYQMTPYPQAGYWVAYSRTAGDEPLVIITMQKSP